MFWNVFLEYIVYSGMKYLDSEYIMECKQNLK